MQSVEQARFLIGEEEFHLARLQTEQLFYRFQQPVRSRQFNNFFPADITVRRVNQAKERIPNGIER